MARVGLTESLLAQAPAPEVTDEVTALLDLSEAEADQHGIVIVAQRARALRSAAPS